MREDLPALDLCLFELGPDLLRIGETVGDLVPPLFEHLENGLVREPVQQSADDGEAERLGDQVRPRDTKRPGDLLDLPAAFRRLQPQQGQHRHQRYRTRKSV
jgi:hypothetical protein